MRRIRKVALVPSGTARMGHDVVGFRKVEDGKKKNTNRKGLTLGDVVMYAGDNAGDDAGGNFRAM